MTQTQWETGMDAGVVGTRAMPVIDSLEPVDGIGSASVDEVSCGVVVAAMVVVIECMGLYYGGESGWQIWMQVDG
jgi:hypothetical protein